MTQYSIQSGDNLWNIAKNQYGANIKSDADIKKAVDLIAKNNNLANPNMIYAGTNLELPDADSIFGTQKSEFTQLKNDVEYQPGGIDEQNGNQTDVFAQMENWMDNHADLMEEYLYGEIDESQYNEEQSKLGASFDFMQGHDYNNEELYNQQTLKLGQGEVEAKDLDGDGQVNFSEYFSDEMMGNLDFLKDAVDNGELTQQDAIDMLKDVYLQAQTVFSIIDQKMGNGDSYIDETEFQQYYQHLDEYQGGNGEAVRDGKIELDYTTEYPEFLANQIDIDEETQKKAENIAKHLLGYDAE